MLQCKALTAPLNLPIKCDLGFVRKNVPVTIHYIQNKNPKALSCLSKVFEKYALYKCSA